ncbi:putative proton-dependent oligopeptide transporter family, PTR2 family proton/oligopeptide symporter [Helianthus annuus]|uniref:Proton-dependent oligopeptide transporter family, major facilitator superfamily n=1 Tax=Helianthus annuus TaxID=4232 RepID=A0A251V3U9_HELAN|nr:protein NRT1/ PTR FAMILY 5.6 [Helianthus annuus]KAF5811972.1 putative proton-dependent oligopeptide transporter family, major facilitator superfamily [Helianthus annuus]KAJ0590848.1 putative proton-dependent oligopeptide transporter family, PTR2 family proton/oligopeptide symporter [Helianthus annuus]KAJ0598557.1 putative proton-dependent oligopeptide transporter family, PTR2 family proton/oligopeptide symporter [Helianthus annuus]KAJ0759155.1 putative proton-dependent oligopeptide transport
MEHLEKGQELEVDEQKWVYDSSFDHRGHTPLRASTGAWKASLFIIVIEFAERLSYFGIATSLIIYLTKVIHQDVKTSAKSANQWIGVTTLMPLVGGFLADAYLGRFGTVLLSSIIYLMGLILLTMSSMIPSLKPCASDELCLKPRKIHEIVFFVAIYLISVGTGGHKPSLESFGADQFDDNHPEERKKKMSFFNWWNAGLCAGLVLGVTVIVYVQDHVGWGQADIILTMTMACSIVIYVIGRPFYRYRKPGSPIKPLFQVCVAAFTKRNLPYPSSPNELHEDPKPEKAQQRLLCHTEAFKFLDKAAIIEEKYFSEKKQCDPWRLSTVTKVEELKLLLNMIPIWLTSLPFGMCVAQSTTFFIKQGALMDRKITHRFALPPASIYGLAAFGMIFLVTVYDRILIPILRRITRTERGINILQRIGIGMVFSVITMIVSAIVEKKRLNVVQNDPLHGSATMSVFWLAPQFIFFGIADGFTLVGLQEYFYDQVPDSMRSLGIALYLSVIGAGNFLSSFLITIVDHATTKVSGESWFGKDLNSSRIDNFYLFLAAITAANLCVYVYVASRYSYKNVQKKTEVGVADCYHGDGHGTRD